MISKNTKFTQEDIIHREKVRSVYRNGYGPSELFNIFYDGGLFRVIRPEELDARNRALMKAEEIGLLDESVIRGFIDMFLGDNGIKLEEEKKVVNTKINTEEDIEHNIFEVS